MRFSLRGWQIKHPHLARFLLYVLVGGMGTLAQYVVFVSMVKLGGMKPTPASAVGAGVGAIVNYVLNCLVVFKGRKNHWQTAPKFAVVAGLALGVNTALMFLLCEKASVHYLVAQVLTSGAVLVVTYVLNSRMTFKRKN